MKRFALAACAAFFLASGAVAQDLSIDSIVTLAATGLGDQAIIAKIKSEGAHFDLTVDQMISLKQRGVSSDVIAAMMAKPEPAKIPLSLDSPDPMVPHPTGVYIMTGSGASAKMLKLNPTVTNQSKTGGIWGYALTGGIASMSIKAAIPNETAKVKTLARPTFYFFFDQSNNVTQETTWATGDNTVLSSPAEFTLIELMRKKGRREARVGSLNIGGAKSGVMDKDSIPFDYVEVRPGVYKVEAQNITEKGEYGFIFALSGSGAGGASTARIFDFSVE